MSKKILKRSLALGALMAFVITGSAMAATAMYTFDTDGNHTLNRDIIDDVKGDEDLTRPVENGGYEYAIYHNGGTLTIEGKHLDNIDKVVSAGGDNGTNYGSVLYSTANATKLNLIDCYIQNNTHLGVNGHQKAYAVLHLNTNTDIESCHFIENKAVYMGGALKLHGEKIYNIKGTEFSKNEASSGGAILTNPNVELNLNGGNTFDGNIATGNEGGGAINVQNGVVINFNGEKNDFKNNITAGNGGAIYVFKPGVLNFNGTANFTGNKAGVMFAADGTASGGTANDIYNNGTVNINKDAEVSLEGGMTGSGIVKVDGTLKLGGAINGNQVTFGAGSKLVLLGDGDQFTDVYAVNGAGDGAQLTITEGAKLEVEGIKYNTYNIAKGFDNVADAKEKFEVSNLNTLMEGNWTADKDNGLQLEVVAKSEDVIADQLGVTDTTAGALTDIIAAANDANAPKTEAAQNVVKFANEIANAPAEVAAAAAEAVIKMAEAGGNSATAANIVKNVTGVTNDRLSFNCGHSAPHKGGHGVGLFEEGSGADIWVEYVHGKDEVEDMPSSAGASSYEGQYNGIVMGVDFKKVNKFQSGIAFNYGEGDTNSVGTSARTHSDYDFWGIGYYGSIHNDDSNVIFDINYAKSDSDVTNKNLAATYEASPETTTWTAGVKVEKLYQNNNVQIVPYTGLRYMSIDADDYATKCGTFNYKMDRQDIWLLPVGVSIKQEIVNDNGWTVSPRVDLSYIWAFGDTDSNMEFATALNTKTNIGYDVMDDGSFLGLVGIEAHKGQWGYGIAYSYQKGDHSESKKWFVDVNYSF